MSDSRSLCSLLLAAFLAMPSFVVFASEGYPQQQFVANISASMPEWRPHRAYNADEAQILSAVYEGLFVYDPYNLDPVPALAESWTVSSDGLIWTFQIRKDAAFSNGDPITAATFRDSWMNLLAPSQAAPYASLLDDIEGARAFRTGTQANPSTVGISAVAEYTLQIRLVAPAEHLTKILCHHSFSAVHASDLARTEGSRPDARYRPVSSGPFIVASISDSEILLEKNTAYWDAPQVHLPSIRLLVTDNADDLTRGFNRGEIHWLAGASKIDQVLDATAVHITPMFATEYFFFRTTWGAGADSAVRKALLLSVPWEELRNSYLIPATTLVFPIAGYPEIEGIENSDIPQAKKMIEAWKADHKDASTELVISIPESENYTALAGILKSVWEELGFTVAVRTTPYSRYYNSLRTDDYTIGITSWIGDFADPLTFLEMFRPDSSLNDSGWSNSEYERMIREASAKKLSKDRYAKLAEAEKLLLDEGVILPVAHNPSLNVLDMDGIAGWYPNALDIHPFKFVRFTQKKPLPGVALLH